MVALGYLELSNLGNYTALRCARVLRPLRTITKIEQMRVGWIWGLVSTCIPSRCLEI